MVDHCSRLPNDLLELIGFKLDAVADRIRFRAVSKRWRSLLPFRQPPWLMTAVSINQTSGSFLSTDGRLYEIPFGKALEGDCIGSTGSWLIIFCREDQELIRLLNPFSGVSLNFPKIIGCGAYSHLEKIVLAPSSLNGDCIAVGTPSWSWTSRTCRFSVIGHSDARWTDFNLGDGIFDFIFYEGRLCAVTWGGMITVFNFHEGTLDPEVSIFMDGFEDKGDHYYLVECCGEILMANLIVRQVNRDSVQHNIVEFKVYRLDLENKTRTLLESLGEHSLFLGHGSASFSLVASDYFGLVKKNCIYFACREPWSPWWFMGVFDMDDKSEQLGHEGVYKTDCTPLAWIVST